MTTIPKPCEPQVYIQEKREFLVLSPSLSLNSQQNTLWMENSVSTEGRMDTRCSREISDGLSPPQGVSGKSEMFLETGLP